MHFLHIMAYCPQCQKYVKYDFSDTEQFVMNIPNRDQRQQAHITVFCPDCDYLMSKITGVV